MRALIVGGTEFISLHLDAEDTPRGLYWGDYARHKIAGEDVLFERPIDFTFEDELLAKLGA